MKGNKLVIQALAKQRVVIDDGDADRGRHCCSSTDRVMVNCVPLRLEEMFRQCSLFAPSNRPVRDLLSMPGRSRDHRRLPCPCPCPSEPIEDVAKGRAPHENNCRVGFASRFA
jgi:hypothetical protein